MWGTGYTVTGKRSVPDLDPKLLLKISTEAGTGYPNPLPALTIAILILHFLHSEFSSLVSSEGVQLEKGEDMEEFIWGVQGK